MPSYTSQTKKTVMNGAYTHNYINGNHNNGLQTFRLNQRHYKSGHHGITVQYVNKIATV